MGDIGEGPSSSAADASLSALRLRSPPGEAMIEKSRCEPVLATVAVTENARAIDCLPLRRCDDHCAVPGKKTRGQKLLLSLPGSQILDGWTDGPIFFHSSILPI